MIDKTDDTYFADNEPWIKLDPVPRLERALTGNADCQSALPIGARALVVDSGPSGGPEALVYAHIEDLALGCIYGHIRRAPTGGYAAMLLHSDRFISAEDKLLLFRRFDYWIGHRMDFTPLLGVDFGDTFAEAPTLGYALMHLIKMIETFSVKLRWPLEEEARLALSQDLRILGVFPFRDPSEPINARLTPPSRLRSVQRHR